MRERLRAPYTDAELADLYSNTYDHRQWPDHIERVEQTITFARRVFPTAASVADLSCGDGAITSHLARDWEAHCILGDLVPGNQYVGRIEDTIRRIDPVDVYVCSETLEHVANPDRLLARIRAKAQRLILSTPCDETITNPEHYWRWSASDVCKMLENTGWQPVAFTFLAFPDLDVRYQLWAAQ